MGQPRKITCPARLDLHQVTIHAVASAKIISRCIRSDKLVLRFKTVTVWTANEILAQQSRLPNESIPPVMETERDVWRICGWMTHADLTYPESSSYHRDLTCPVA